LTSNSFTRRKKRPGLHYLSAQYIRLAQIQLLQSVKTTQLPLQPTPNGLPIKIYVFSKDQVWANYEAIQADIFDHILAVVPEFDLRVYQNPSGSDFRGLVSGDR